MPHVVCDDDIRTDGDRRCENVAIGLVVGQASVSVSFSVTFASGKASII